MASMISTTPLLAKRRADRSLASRPTPGPFLENGYRLSQPEFHRRYELMPRDVKAELIGGVVYMASPLGIEHGDTSRLVATVLGVYQAETPGVKGSDNATTILADDSEPQPDHSLRLLPERGGQTRVRDKYLVGAPELIIEVALSTAALDLHGKKDDYRKAGVLEYLVVLIGETQQARAFDLTKERAQVLPADGIWRSRVFPGLWIDTKALLSGDASRLLRTARKGLRSAEHKAFAQPAKKPSRPRRKR
jgi:Uma2 family endonuclease